MRRPPPAKKKGCPTGPRRIDGEVLDVRAAAALVGITEKQVRARVLRGHLPHRRWGGRLVFLRAELLTFLAGLPGVNAAEALANVPRSDVAP